MPGRRQRGRLARNRRSKPNELADRTQRQLRRGPRGRNHDRRDRHGGLWPLAAASQAYFRPDATPLNLAPALLLLGIGKRLKEVAYAAILLQRPAEVIAFTLRRPGGTTQGRGACPLGAVRADPDAEGVTACEEAKFATKVKGLQQLLYERRPSMVVFVQYLVFDVNAACEPQNVAPEALFVSAFLIIAMFRNNHEYLVRSPIIRPVLQRSRSTRQGDEGLMRSNIWQELGKAHDLISSRGWLRTDIGAYGRATCHWTRPAILPLFLRRCSCLPRSTIRFPRTAGSLAGLFIVIAAAIGPAPFSRATRA